MAHKAQIGVEREGHVRAVEGLEVVSQVVWTRVGGGLVSPQALALWWGQAPALRDSVDFWNSPTGHLIGPPSAGSDLDGLRMSTDHGMTP